MTPDELRKLADEATPGPWKVLAAGSPLVRRGTGEVLHVGGRMDARLIALAPDLARLCAEFAEIAERVDDPVTNKDFDAALAKLSSLEPQ